MKVPEPVPALWILRELRRAFVSWFRGDNRRMFGMIPTRRMNGARALRPPYFASGSSYSERARRTASAQRAR